MADNVPITAGAGTTIATDDVGGVHYQRVKLDAGAADASTPVLAGGGVEADALRVTIANDSTGVVSVDDNNGSLTVDGTLAVTLAAGAAAIAKAEDAASANLDVGVPAMAVQKATPVNTAGTDGDYEMLQMSAGRLWASAVIDTALPAGTNAIGKLAANSGVDIGDVDVTSLPNVTLATGTNTNEVVGDVAHDAGIAGNPLTVGGVASAAAPTDVNADQDAVRAWFLRNGAQAVNVTAAGALVAGDATNGLDVDVTRLPALVAGTANIGDVDVLTVPSPLSSAGGGNESAALRVTLANDSTGLVSIDDNGSTLTVDAPVGTPVNVQIGNATLVVGVIDETGASAVDALAVGGGTAHDAVDSGNPVKIGGKAIADVGAVTVVAANDRANLNVGLDGTLLVRDQTSISNALKERGSTTGATEVASTVFGATGSTKNCITTIAVFNTSTTVSTYIDFTDGAGGTIMFSLPLPAGGGAVVNLPVPLVQTTANVALYWKVASAATTVYVSMIGFKSKA
jgi:hypothetical protein